MVLNLNPNFVIEIFIILLILFILSQIFHLFDIKGSIAAVIVGAIVSFAGGLNWLILLIVFASVSQIVTKIGFKKKVAIQQQEGKGGERKVSNVVYGGAIGVIISLINVTVPYNFPYFIIFATAFAAIASDTFASEIGVLDSKTYLITTMKRCKTGLNGGVSKTGTLASLVGSGSIALTEYIIQFRAYDYYYAIIVLIAGFAASQFDSLLGALYENNQKLSKGSVNLLASLFAVVLATVILIA